MKVLLMGYSGSGKSTLCRQLAAWYGVPSLHLDQVQFLPGWQERAITEQQAMVTAFLNSHPGGWIVDGNYKGLCYERRIQEADRILLLLFNRWSCLYRCTRRYFTYRGKSRPDVPEGCREKLDWEFVRWILWEGRSRRTVNRYRRLAEEYPAKVIVLKNQRQLDAFLRELCPNGME